MKALIGFLSCYQLLHSLTHGDTHTPLSLSISFLQGVVGLNWESQIQEYRTIKNEHRSAVVIKIRLGDY